MNVLCNLPLWSCLCCLLATTSPGARKLPDCAARPSSTGSTPARDLYSQWHMPGNPSVSCGNEADCYPTELKYVDGNIYAKRREDERFILIPPQKVERSGDNPDGRNH